MSTATSIGLEAPQNRLVERVCLTRAEDGSGRYAIARDDINPGELVLLSVPYAVALNPNEVVSAMYVSANVEECEVVSHRGKTGGREYTKMKKNKLSSNNDNVVALTPCVTFCCCCLRCIPTGTPFLNCETIEYLSDVVAAEHAEYERLMWQRKQENANQAGPIGNDAGTVGGECDKQRKKMQKPSRSSKMRSKGYVSLKQKLLDNATARREAVVYERQQVGSIPLGTNLPVSWPERVLEEKCLLEEDLLARGVCGCAGCGVVVYCSEVCWLTFREMHHSTGACRILRKAYPSLMKAFMSRAANGKKGMSPENLSVDMWSPKRWLRRASDEKAWEMMSLLLAALLVGRCTREGYSGNMKEDGGESSRTTDADESSDNGEENGIAFPLAGEEADASVAHNYPQSAAPSAVQSKSRDITVDNVPVAKASSVPREVEAIRLARLRCGTAVEVLDSTAVECGSSSGTINEALTQLFISIKDNTVVDVRTDGVGPYVVSCPRWCDTAALVTNISVLNKESRATFRRYYRRFCQHVLPWIGQDESGDETLTVSADFFDRMCGAVQCNNFGLFSSKESCIGVSIFPEASYFNHSCLPNLCRVMYRGNIAAFYALQSIRKGEPLTICYVDVQEASTAERRRTLLTSYRFFCECRRCHGYSDEDGKGDTVMSEIRFCDTCDARGYLRPLAPEDAEDCRHWEMGDIKTGECTICRQRKPWVSS
uniref:SET domain-containing protein n=1 Tax=Trypanosoma congolense (strain IL3000) TaxID=1068625 RepID=G0URM6_TRYCI|nr:conserved hypothetical protein [Trypanosoma congolense IL3000]